MAHYSPIFAAAVVCSVFLYGSSKFPTSRLVTENHVAILGEAPNGDFHFASDEEPNGGSFRPCPDDVKSGIDTPELLKKGIGYIADYATWEERGTCKSIWRSDMGFWFKDKRNNFTYRRVSLR